MSMRDRRRLLLATLGGGIPLSDLPVGSILKILEGGVLTDFYVSKHNYESGLNGAGRTLLVRKDSYDQRQWHNASANAWASCTLLSWLNSTYLNLLDANIRGVIGTTKYYYTPGNGTTSVTTRSDAVFMLSVTELGISASNSNTEGTTLPIAGTLRIVRHNGSTTDQWVRSPRKNGSVYVFVISGGKAGYDSCGNKHWSRPVFTLPAEAPCELNADGTYTLLL